MMLQLGGLLPLLTLPGFHLYSWIDWSSVSNVFCLWKQKQRQSVLSGSRTCNYLISMTTCLCCHTRTCTLQIQMEVITQLLLPTVLTLGTGMPGTTQKLKPCMVNPPEARLVTCRRNVQVSQTEVAEPTVPQKPHTARQHKGSIAFASLVITRYPLTGRPMD